jgi:hypothetical protein
MLLGLSSGHVSDNDGASIRHSMVARQEYDERLVEGPGVLLYREGVLLFRRREFRDRCA